jgi:hypothetical protein
MSGNRLSIPQIFSWDSVVGIVITLQGEWSGDQITTGSRDFSLPQKCLDRLWGPHSLLFMGSFLGVKRSGYEVDHSPPASAEE